MLEKPCVADRKAVIIPSHLARRARYLPRAFAFVLAIGHPLPHDSAFETTFKPSADLEPEPVEAFHR